MSSILHSVDELNQKTPQDAHNEFKLDIRTGLQKKLKQISTKYLYDEKGCELFNQITRHHDYYLTRTEIEILNTYKKYLSDAMGNQPFNLVELGPGEGIKTDILIQQFLQDSHTFSYIPIDISKKYLQALLANFEKTTSTLDSTALHADYFAGLQWLNKNSSRRNVVLFLGSSIGNFDPKNASVFLEHLHASLNDGDLVLLGLDLCKDINILMRAYNDSDGITTQFNLNILRRINQELGANFDVSKFTHYPTYNVHTGAMESYLVSMVEQEIDITELGQIFPLSAIEPIHIEYSYKYQIKQIEELAKNFTILRHLTDPRGYFVDSLWRVNK